MSDVTFWSEGTIWMFRPESDAAKHYVQQNVFAEHWLGNAFAVEHRFVSDLVSGLRNDGFSVECVRKP